MAKSYPDPFKLKKKIRTRLNKLEKLSPSQIRRRIAGHRSGLNQNTELLARWLCEELDLERMVIKTLQNVNDNLEISVSVNGLQYNYRYHVKTSLQDFLGIKKRQDVVPGVRLTEEQAILVRAVVDRDGGDEARLLQAIISRGMASSQEITGFVSRVKAHPEWHDAMHESGLYPADIFAAAKSVRRAAKKL